MSSISINMKDGNTITIKYWDLKQVFEIDAYDKYVTNLLTTYCSEKQKDQASSNEESKNENVQSLDKNYGSFSFKEQKEWPQQLKAQWKSTKKYLKKPKKRTSAFKKLMPKKHWDDPEKYYKTQYQKKKSFIFAGNEFLSKSGLTNCSFFVVIIFLFIDFIVFIGRPLGWVKGATDDASFYPALFIFLIPALIGIIVILIEGLIRYYARFLKKKQIFISIGPNGCIFKTQEKKELVFFCWDDVAYIE